VWDSGCHNGLLAGHAEASLSLRPEESSYYKPDAHGQLSAAAEALDRAVFPYLEAIVGSSDRPLEELQALEPAREEPQLGDPGSSI
jgi:hypothetical protein